MLTEKKNKFVNSAKEFQKVTNVSDSLLKVMAPFFKFPEWVANRKIYEQDKNASFTKFKQNDKVKLIDINTATQGNLMKIYGVGEIISKRILIMKESFGGFVSMEQLKDIWGLSSEVFDNLTTHFKIVPNPNLKKNRHK